MTKEILIGGVSITALKAQRDAMQQEANKFVSDAIAEGSGLVRELLEAESKEQADTLAEQALEVFQNAQLVAGTCGVVFMLPYYEEYGGYDSSEILSSMIDDSENEFVERDWRNKNAVWQLHNLLGIMESDSRGWHSSTC